MEVAPLFSHEFLFSHWEDEFQSYLSDKDEDVRALLTNWNRRDRSQNEMQLDGSFVDTFFRKLWGYWGTGRPGPRDGYTLLPSYPVPGAGQTGGTGQADLALANFSNSKLSDTAQVLCEFKDIRSSLDAPQNRKGNDRSPSRQCLDYLKYAFDNAHVNTTVLPTWGIVTDMNEFRLYHRKSGNARYQKFFIFSNDEKVPSLLSPSSNAARYRFIFSKLFSIDMLLAKFGQSPLDSLLNRQWNSEKNLERSFYKEYQSYREHVYRSILEANPNFSGSRGDLVRMTQRFLDRCIFLLFCEDMGKMLAFPPGLLRDVLIQESLSPNYSPDFNNIWSLVKQLFHTMRDGGNFPPNHRIYKFNGGLFQHLEPLESLTIPNRVFCAAGQGESPLNLRNFKNTLLYLAATYNFGQSTIPGERNITVYTLGRIFEQSITDLDYMRGVEEGVPTIAELSKRKRDGVYYTPEWVTQFIVEQVVGDRLAQERQNLGLILGVEISQDQIAKYRKAKNKPKGNPATVHMQLLDTYQKFLDRITILDPACGSGAFLIQALFFLQQHRAAVASERERITGERSIFDLDTVTNSILAKNLFGIDINPESVEITQLALWLNTATPGKPLSTLDKHIVCGNSLVGPDYSQYHFSKIASKFEGTDRNEQEKVNVFDWRAAFPEILSLQLPADKRGFDCIIGNPPYVKLQHLKQVVPLVAEYLVESKITQITDIDAHSPTDLGPRFKSTQNSNFDLYLPFIERGISLLNESGSLGFIAPNVWLLSEYGKGLKRYLKKTRSLRRWVDFKDFPVFDEAMTYTSLQFYQGRPAQEISFAFAPHGQLSSLQNEGTVRYEDLECDEPWIFLPDEERSLIDRLTRQSGKLIDKSYVSSIFVGIQTSADNIFHLEKVASGRYLCSASGEQEEVELEDSIMRPLVSGGEAKRYTTPKTSTYILFPYETKDGRSVLLGQPSMTNSYPKAWRYLQRFESELRSREKSSFNDNEWYRFGRNQNIDKQHIPKIGIAQTAPELRAFYDPKGDFCLNNVRVNGIMVEESYAWFVVGILNSRICDFVFRRIAKPKEPRPSGSYFEANKQYLAPLPVPEVKTGERNHVERLAKRLNELQNMRRETVFALDSRIESSQMRSDPRDPEWIWADVRSVEHWKKQNPKGLRGKELNAWAKDHAEKLLTAKCDELESQIKFGDPMYALEDGGELRFFVGRTCIIQGVFVNSDEAHIILSQWQQKARNTFASDSFRLKNILKKLLDLRTTSNSALISQINDHTIALKSIEEEIFHAEISLDNYIFDLFNMDDTEKRLVTEATRDRLQARLPNLAFKNC